MLSQDLDKVASSRSEFFKYFYDLHNMVNLRLGKPYFPLDKALKKACGEECGYKNQKNTSIYLFLLLCFVAIFIYLLLTNKK
jgi:hypothetical protein